VIIRLIFFSLFDLFKKMSDFLVLHCGKNRRFFNIFDSFLLEWRFGISLSFYIFFLVFLRFKFFLPGLSLFPSIFVSSQQKIKVLVQGQASLLPHLDPFTGGKGNIFQFFIVEKTSIGSFYGIWERNSQPSQENSSSCWYLTLVYLENARIISKHWSYVSQKFWKNSSFVVVFLDNGEFGSIHKCVFLLRMPMKIQEHY